MNYCPISYYNNLLRNKIEIKNLVQYTFCFRFNHHQSIKVESEVNYPKRTQNIMDGKHPYYKIHPWRSKKAFIKDIVKKVIYNKDGLVAINKPYGISSQLPSPDKGIKRPSSGIPGEVKYTLMDSLPNLAAELGYLQLKIVRTPEKFTSGVVLLANDEKISNAIEKSLRRAEGMRLIPKKYWVVTRRIPIFKNGERQVAIKPTVPPNKKGKPEPIIVTSYSINERKRSDIKVLNVQFRVISYGCDNLASLTEIKSSTTKFHAVRLFSSTVLMSPVLGDQVYGSLVQNVMGKMIKISPFTDAAHIQPKLDGQLLQLLKVGDQNMKIIPAHVHLREIHLPWFLKHGNDVTITAPLYPEFKWTCDRLDLEYDEEFTDSEQLKEKNHKKSESVE